MSKRTRLMLELAAENQSLDTGRPSYNAGISGVTPLEKALEESAPWTSFVLPVQPDKFVPIIDTSCTITCSQVVALNNVCLQPHSLDDYNNISIRENNTDGSFLNNYLDPKTSNNENKDNAVSDKDMEDKENYYENQEMPEDENIKLITRENRPLNEEKKIQEANIYEMDSVVNTDPKIANEDDIPLAELARTIPNKGYKANGEPRIRKKKRTSIELKRDQEKRHNLLIETHKVLPPCQTNICRKKCASLIFEDERNEINLNFWKLTAQERRNYILASCSRSGVQKRRVTDESYRKNNTFKYYLKNKNGNVQEVCKSFFLTTFGFNKNNDRLLHDTLSKTPKNQLSGIPDGRGRSKNKHKLDNNIINEHIESFHPTISHYRREHAPNRLYLPSDISITTMYNDFLTKYPNIKLSYDTYRVRVKQKNISFAKLGQEECELCEEFKLHGHTKDSFQEGCEVCSKWQIHIKQANESRQLYREQAVGVTNNNTVYVSVDLQKVIMLPRIDSFKRVIFAKRLIAYNESFVCLGSTTKLPPFAVLWNESISGRNKEDIVSAFYAFFLWRRDTNNFVFWLDNCSSQNKNWCFLTFLVRIGNSNEIAVNEISVNYFEPGHTFMAADSFHHQVELSLKKQGKTYDFGDFVSSIRNARHKNKVEAKLMSYTDFYLWKDLKSQTKVKQDSNRPLLANIKQLKATRGCFVLKYKNSFDPNEEFKTLDFLCKKAMKKSGLVTTLTSLSQPCGFPKSKKDALNNLLNDIIPENRKDFWKNLPECEG